MENLISVNGINAHRINTIQGEQKTYKDLLNFFSNNVKVKILKGYSPKNKIIEDMVKRYHEAKKPATAWIEGKLEKELVIEPSLIDEFLKYNCWFGLYLPDGYILVDIDDKNTGAMVAQRLSLHNIKCIIIQTPNGYQFIFKDTGKVKTQKAKFLTLAGIVVDYRLAGKGYTVLPTPITENRRIVTIPESVDPMPDFFVSVRHAQKDGGEEDILHLPIYEGSRHVTFHAHICRMWAWMQKYKLDVDINQVALKINSLFIEPPLDEKEVMDSIKAAEQLPPPAPVREYSYNNKKDTDELKGVFNLDYDPVLPQSFDIQDKELVYLIEKKDETYIPVPICQPFIVVATIKPEDGEESCFVVRDNLGREAVMSMTVSDKKNFEKEISTFLERPLDSEKIKLLQRYVGEYFRLNNAHFIEKSGLSRTGWHHGTFYIPSREYNDVVWTDDNLKDAYSCKGDTEHQRVILRDILRTPASVIVLSALAAPLLKLFNIPNMIVFVSGPKGKGKTTIVSFAVSLYGNPRCLKGTWFSTKVGKEGFLYMNTDLPTLIDELETLGENIGEVINSIYQYESGSGKIRGNKNLLNRKTRRLSGTLLITSEKDLDTLIATISNRRSAPLGVYRRVLEIKADENFFTYFGSDRKFNLVPLNKFLLTNYGWVGKEWIAFIENNVETIKEMYKKNLQEMSKVATLEGAFSAMLTALDILLSMQIIDKDIHTTISKYLFSVAIEHRDKNQHVDDIALKFKSKLADFCNMNERMFVLLQHDRDKSLGFWGKVEDKHIFIFKEVFERICREHGFVPNHVLKALQKKGDLETQKGFEKQIRYENKRHWGYYIKNVFELDDEGNGFSSEQDSQSPYIDSKDLFCKM
jgi:hypothetical protein